MIMNSDLEMQNVNADTNEITATTKTPALKRPSLGPDGMRIRVNVPADDEAVVEWLNLQHDRSLSIRMIIRDAIRRYGMKDFFATSTDSIRKSATPGPKPAATKSAESEMTTAFTPVRQAEPVQSTPVRRQVEVMVDDPSLQSLMDLMDR